MPINFVAASSHWLNMQANPTGAQNRSRFTLGSWFIGDLSQTSNLIGFSTNNGGVPTSNTRAAVLIKAASPVDGLESQTRAPDSGARVDGDGNPNDVLPNFWHLCGCAVDVANDFCELLHDEFSSGTPVVAYTNAATDNTASACGAIGAEENGSTNFLDGRMDHQMVWSELKTEDDFATMWHTHGACVAYFGLQNRWLLSGPPGSAAGTITDHGPLQQNLTAQGGCLFAEQDFLQPRRRAP